MPRDVQSFVLSTRCARKLERDATCFAGFGNPEEPNFVSNSGLCFLRVHLWSSCQNPCQCRVSCTDGRPLSAKLSVMGWMQKQFARTGWNLLKVCHNVRSATC